MNIRAIRSNDYETVHKLIVKEMGHGEVSFTALSTNLDAMKSRDNYILYVMEYNSQVVGFISAVVLFGCIDGCYIDITCLVVAQAFQNRGIGKALLDFVESFGKINKIEHFSVTSGLHRKKAHNFYKKNGYELGGYAFCKGLVIIESKI